jgi:acyl dehydratase
MQHYDKTYRSCSHLSGNERLDGNGSCEGPIGAVGRTAAAHLQVKEATGLRVFDTLAHYAAAEGTEIGVSGWIDIDQDRIDRFAEATGDHQWIHVDPQRTMRELAMPTIAHGYLTLSLVPHFVAQLVTVRSVVRAINYGADKLRFLAMVPVGSRLRGRMHLEKVVAGPDMLRAHSRISVELEGSDKPALVAQTISLLYERAGDHR